MNDRIDSFLHDGDQVAKIGIIADVERDDRLPLRVLPHDEIAGSFWSDVRDVTKPNHRSVPSLYQQIPHLLDALSL